MRPARNKRWRPILGGWAEATAAQDVSSVSVEGSSVRFWWKVRVGASRPAGWGFVWVSWCPRERQACFRDSALPSSTSSSRQPSLHVLPAGNARGDAAGLSHLNPAQAGPRGTKLCRGFDRRELRFDFPVFDSCRESARRDVAPPSPPLVGVGGHGCLR